MDRPTVYIETSIVSYLAARPSRDPVTLRNQQLTHAWWNTRRERYALRTSDLVISEAQGGDPVMAERRIEILAGIPRLDPVDEAAELARDLRAQVPLPLRAATDSLHIALATVHRASYLLTWDSRHIANPRLAQRIERVCLSRGYAAPALRTPLDLMGT